MRVLLVSTDLMIASTLEGAARSAGAELATTSAANADQAVSAAPPALVAIDLACVSDPAEMVEQLRQQAPDAKLLAFGPHVHKAKLEAAQAAGCDFVLSRGQFHRSAGAIFAELANAS